MCGLKPSLYTYANMFLLVSQSGQLKHHHTRREKKQGAISFDVRAGAEINAYSLAFSLTYAG